MPAALKQESNRVQGCQSTVFMHARKRPGSADVVEFLADSDADIVRGELALLQTAVQRPARRRGAGVRRWKASNAADRSGQEPDARPTQRHGGMIKRVQRFAGRNGGEKITNANRRKTRKTKGRKSGDLKPR